jgi:hypothetical protein
LQQAVERRRGLWRKFLADASMRETTLLVAEVDRKPCERMSSRHSSTGSASSSMIARAPRRMFTARPLSACARSVMSACGRIETVAFGDFVVVLPAAGDGSGRGHHLGGDAEAKPLAQ